MAGTYIIGRRAAIENVRKLGNLIRSGRLKEKRFGPGGGGAGYLRAVDNRLSRELFFGLPVRVQVAVATDGYGGWRVAGWTP